MLLKFTALALWFTAFICAYGYYLHKVKDATPTQKNFMRNLILAVVLALPVILLLI